MKKLLLFLLCLAFFGAQTVKADVVLNATNFPDANFRTYISNLTGVSVGSTISNAKLAEVNAIYIRYLDISSLQGIEYFTDLTNLNCSNNQLTSLDLKWNTKLISLNCNYNQLTSLDLKRNTSLEQLWCGGNNLTSLDVSKNLLLRSLNCYNNLLTSLNVSYKTELTALCCEYNQLTSLDVSKNTELTLLYCNNNQLTSLDVSKNTELTDLHCNNNQLTSLDVSKNTELTLLFCNNNQLTSLDVSKNTQLTDLRCNSNNIGYLNLSNNTELEFLNCESNKIDQLNLSNNTKLTTLYCDGNRLTNLNLDNNMSLTTADVRSQSSTRRFTVNSYGSSYNNCWTLFVNTTDASRIRALKIDGVSKTPKVTASGWLVVSEDLKKIPQTVQYEINTGNAAAGWMPVVVNYDVKRYGVYIDGKELTSLNFYDIPGLKSGTAYFYDESSGLGWDGTQPTLVLNNAKIEGVKGLYNKGCYSLKIIARGNNSITATDWTGFETDPAVMTTISGGGTLWFTAAGDRNSGIYNADVSTLKITDGTSVICQGDGYGFFDDGGSLYIQGNSKFACYGNKYASVELPIESKCKFDSNIGIRYPVDAYIGNGYHVFYAGTTTDVQQDWVVFGPDNQATQDLIEALTSTSIQGDVNGDKKVDIADAQSVLNFIADEDYLQSADVNNDSKVDIADYQSILNIIADQ